MKKTVTWHTVRAALAQRKPIGTPRPATDFWREFHARLPAHAAAAAPVRRAPATPVWQWSVAGLCASLVLAAGYLGLARAATVRSTIQSYQIEVPHTAVMLMTGADDDATILWVAGMECE